MSETTTTTAPPDPTTTTTQPPAETKAAEKKLLDDLKKAQAKAKELEAKLAEAQPYVEKFKGHEEAKSLEAQREAEARAKQESDVRARQDMDARRERAILKSLLGVVPPGDDELAEFAVWKLSSDPSIVYDPETNSFTGLAEARDALRSSPRFAVGKPGEPPKKPAPGLPDTKVAAHGGAVDAKFANVKTYAELLALGLPAVTEFYQKNPEQYAAMVAAHESSRRGYIPKPALAR